MNDLRFAQRQLLKNPGFTAVAVLTLALGIGANLTIFAVVDAVLLRPLPFPESERLVTPYNTYPNAGIDRNGASLANYYERRGLIPAFSSLSICRPDTAVVGEPGSTMQEEVLHVSPEFFTTLGSGPVIGRAFTEEETTYQSHDAAILTDEYWRTFFNADPNVLGKTLRVNGSGKTIVGVLPPGFRFLSSKARVFLPLSSGPDRRGPEHRHSGGGFTLIGRLKPGATREEAQSQIDAHNASIAGTHPKPKMVAEAGFRSIVAPLRADHVRSIRPILLLLQTGALFLLLIGAVNLVNLLLVRASARAKEMAIRQSLGAGRRQVLGQVLVETELIALLGGLVGLALGASGIQLLTLLGVDRIPMGPEVGFDGRLAAMAVTGSLLLGVFVAAPIAWIALRNHLANALNSESRTGTSNHAAKRLRHGFIVAQIALAFVLLAGAALLTTSLHRAMSVSPGFQADHVMVGGLDLPWNAYPGAPARLAFAERLLEQVEQLPGVRSAAIGNNVPLSGHNEKSAITIKGRAPAPGESVRAHYFHGVAGPYFNVMGIPLKEGRLLEPADSRSEARTCVVDEDFARRYWPQGSAIGQRLFLSVRELDESEAFTVVGVVGSVKQADMTETDAFGAIYYPYIYHTESRAYLVARTAGQPGLLGPTLQKVIRNADPDLPPGDFRTMESRVTDSLVERTSPALLVGAFAAVALLLAAIGTYGVLSYAVSQSRREIGVRLALGALPSQIRHLFLSLGLRLVAVGSLLGVAGALLARQAMRGILYDVPALPFGTIGISAALLLLVSIAACLVPTWRASRVHPAEALRSE